MTSKLKCPFCGEKLVRHWGMKSPAIYCCDNQKCKRGGVGTEQSWQALIQSRQQLKMLEPIVAELQGRADINAEEARDSCDLVVQWYEKYEQSQRDLALAVDALNAIIATPLNSRVIHDTANKALEQIKHKE